MTFQIFSPLLFILVSLLSFNSLWSSEVSGAPMQWRKLPSAAVEPLGRSRHCLQFWQRNDSVILFGGLSSTPDVWSFQLANSTWKQLLTGNEYVPDVTQPLGRFSFVCQIDQSTQQLFIATGQHNAQLLNDMWRLNLLTLRWTKLNVQNPTSGNGANDMQLRYGSGGGLFRQPYEFQSGGETVKPLFQFTVTHGFDSKSRFSDSFRHALLSSYDEQQAFNSLITSDDNTTSIALQSRIQTTKLSAGSHIPFARCLVSSAVTQDDSQLLIFGGCGSLGNGPCPADDIWRMDTRTGGWSEGSRCIQPRVFSAMTSWPTPSAAANAAAGETNTKVMVFGGQGRFYGNGKRGEIALYDGAVDRWRRMQPTGVSSGSDVDLPVAGAAGPAMTYVDRSTSASGSGAVPNAEPYVLVHGGTGQLSSMFELRGSVVETPHVGCAYVFPIREFHGAMMFLAWTIFLPIGVLLARYTKHIGPKGRWFTLHRIVQSLGLLFNIAGFVAAIIMVTDHRFRLAHHVLGALVFALGIQQPFNAVIRPHVDATHPKTKLRRVWEFVHKNFGRLAVVLGAINVLIGLNLIRAPLAMIILVAIWYAGLLLFVIVAEVKRLRQPAHEEHKQIQ